MRFKTAVIVLIATLLLFTACKPEAVPKHQIVIETIPSHLLDMIDVMQSKSGVFVFNTSLFATGNDTYMVISHGNQDSKMVDITHMEFNKAKKLEVQLTETNASQPRAFTVVKFLDYKKDVAVKNLDGKWPTISTENMSFTSRGNIVKLKNNEIQVKIDDAVLTFNLATELANKLKTTSLSFNENDDVVVHYTFTDNTLTVNDILNVSSSGVAEGKFIGFIDSQSIEAKVEGKATTYRLSHSAKQWLDKNDLKSDQAIKFDYYILNEDSPYITKFYDKN
ncbi:hypothetical protein IMX26_06930 [Clostridium sp. 'deep sea']|uniref:hypothetical protein n=1 Tax=Clostridium sp. 'deep sea' TaxID=2779445 RepID=UPI001896A01D|nr:hypothetical protein [Clostridium sp. 'deep sea']QOR36536.1 hypothetical protein IMX26_06930 [Clostridium sp. 'deep sea']